MPVTTSVDGFNDANFCSSLLSNDGFEIALDPRRWEKLKPWGPDEKSSDFFDIHRSAFFADSANPLLRCLAGPNEDQFVQTLINSEINEPVPVVFHGESGTGKSTLASMLASRLVQQTPTTLATHHSHVMYFTGGDFYRFCLAANERQNLAEFRLRIIGSQGILIDDLDQLSEKYAAQRELIFLIDQMLNQNKPVIATMKNSPWSPTSGILGPLTSRLGSGVVLPVYPPGAVARKAILEHLSRSWCIPLTPAAIDWVTDKLPVTFPKLNHFFVQLKTELKSRNLISDDEPVDVSTLAVIFQQNSDSIESMARQIMNIVAADFQLDAATLKSKSRKQTAVAARGIAIWLERSMVGTSFKKIGSRYGGRDHTTVMHSFQKFDSMMADPQTFSSGSKEANFVKQIIHLKQKLNEAFAGQMTLIN